MKPFISILDKRFRYEDSAHTDIRKTFRKARKEIGSFSRVNVGTIVGDVVNLPANVIPIGASHHAARSVRKKETQGPQADGGTVHHTDGAY